MSKTLYVDAELGEIVEKILVEIQRKRGYKVKKREIIRKALEEYYKKIKQELSNEEQDKFEKGERL